MYRTLSVDNQGRIVLVNRFPMDHDGTEQTTLEKQEDIKHLRRVQSTNFIGRSAIRLVDFFRRGRQHAA